MGNYLEDVASLILLSVMSNQSHLKVCCRRRDIYCMNRGGMCNKDCSPITIQRNSRVKFTRP